MEPIHGKDCLLSIKIDSTYYPVLCAVDMTLTKSRAIVESTSATTGSSRTYKYRGLKDHRVTLSGLTKVDNTDGQISWFYLFQTEGALLIQIIFEDSTGEAYVLEAQALIPEQSINANVNSFASGDITFQLCEEPTLENILPTPVDPICEVQETIQEVLPLGQTYVYQPDLTLSGAQVLWVTRDGIGYVETTGTPGTGQFRVDYAAGRVYFDTSNPGTTGTEMVLIGWQRTF